MCLHRSVYLIYSQVDIYMHIILSFGKWSPIMSSNIASVEMCFTWNCCWIYHGPSYSLLCPSSPFSCTYLSMLPIFSLVLSGWVSQLYLLAHSSPFIYIKFLLLNSFLIFNYFKARFLNCNLPLFNVDLVFTISLFL